LLFSLEQEPEVQGALLALDPSSGYVITMVGGSDFRRSQFNRATQAVRQPGSAFKPIVYVAALDAGYTPASIIMDTPVSYAAGAPNEVWEPKNYDKEFKGPVTFRRALEESRNVATVKILDSVGVRYAIDYAKKMGITSPLEPNLPLALGASGVTLWELTRAYAAFANQGYLPEPILVTEIRDRNNRLLEKNSPKLNRAISPETAYLMTSIMQGVIQEGTGRSVRSIGRPAAGKTGTTDEFVDAWFVGFTPQFLTGVWVGYDDRTPLGRGETGSRAAAPIWLDFMRQAIAYEPALPFPVPKNIVISPIDRETGRPVSWGTPGTLLETFRSENAPRDAREPMESQVFKEELPY
jgi:penicillin-binding protein 1A